MKIKFLIALMLLIPLVGCDDSENTEKKHKVNEADKYVRAYNSKTKTLLSDADILLNGELNIINLPIHGKTTYPIFTTRFKSFLHDDRNYLSCGDTFYVQNDAKLFVTNTVGVQKPTYQNKTDSIEDSIKEFDDKSVIKNITYTDIYKRGANICHGWKQMFTDPNIISYSEINAKAKGFPEKYVVQNLFRLDDEMNRKFSYNFINNLNYIYQYILGYIQSYKEHKTVSILDMGTFSQSTPLITDDYVSIYHLKQLYDNDVLPIVSAGDFFHLKETFISDYNENTPVLQLYDVSECRNYGVNCVFSNNSAYSRNPHAIVVAFGKPNGDRTENASTGSNIWVTALQDEKKGITPTSHVSTIVASMIAHNNNLTIEQIKYILARTADNSRVSFPILGKDFSIGWQRNGANLMYSNEQGFGWVDYQKAIKYIDQCYDDKQCLKRGSKPDFDKFITANNCRILNRESPFKYKCRITVPERIEIENVLLDIDNLSFIKTHKKEHCELIGPLKGLSNRIADSIMPYEISDTLRRLVITVNSSETQNNYIVKAKHENFFGTSDPIVKIEPKQKYHNFINANAFYLEKLKKNSFIDINIETECQLSFDGSVGVRLIGYSK